LPGLAASRLEYFSQNLNPPAELVDAEEEELHRLDRLLRRAWSPIWIVQKAASNAPLDAQERNKIAEIVATLKNQLNLLHEELVRRVAALERQEELASRPGTLKRVVDHVYANYVIPTVASVIGLGVGIVIGRLTS
jgi:Zn-dependent oligopeptidase